jgi:hypothetical protein
VPTFTIKYPSFIESIGLIQFLKDVLSVYVSGYLILFTYLICRSAFNNSMKLINML